MKEKIDAIVDPIRQRIEELREKIQPFIDIINRLGSGIRNLDKGAPAVNKAAGSSSIVINVYGAAGQSATEIANEVQRVLVHQQMQRGRAYG